MSRLVLAKRPPPAVFPLDGSLSPAYSERGGVGVFSRGSTAYTEAGVQVASGVPRYERGPGFNRLDAATADPTTLTGKFPIGSTALSLDGGWIRIETPASGSGGVALTPRVAATPGEELIVSVLVEAITALPALRVGVDFATAANGYVSSAPSPTTALAPGERVRLHVRATVPAGAAQAQGYTLHAGAAVRWRESEWKCERAYLRDPDTGDLIPSPWTPGQSPRAIRVEEGATNQWGSMLPLGGTLTALGTHRNGHPLYRSECTIAGVPNSFGIQRFTTTAPPSQVWAAGAQTVSLRLPVLVEQYTGADNLKGYVRAWYTDGSAQNFAFTGTLPDFRLSQNKGVWHTVEFTFTTDPTKTLDEVRQAYFYGDYAGLGDKMQVGHPMLEYRAYATSWHDGTRTAEVLTFPGLTLRPEESGLGFWMEVGARAKLSTGIPVWFDILQGSGASPAFRAYYQADLLYVQSRDPAGAFHNFTVPISQIPNGWRWLAFRWRGPRMEALVDAELVGSTNAAPTPASIHPTINRLISGGLNLATPNARCSGLRLFPRWPSDAEIRALYLQGR